MMFIRGDASQSDPPPALLMGAGRSCPLILGRRGNPSINHRPKAGPRLLDLDLNLDLFHIHLGLLPLSNI